MMKRALHEAVVVILVSVFLSLVVNGLRPQGIRFSSSIQGSYETGGIEIIKEISIEDAIVKFKGSMALFIDARASDDFARGHIKGALSLPEQQYDEWLDDFISKTDLDMEIITYCDGMHCQQAKNLAEKLSFAGFKNVYYMTNGWSKWNKRYSSQDYRK